MTDSPAADSSISAGVRRTLRISFLGFNPLSNGYDGRGLINIGADQTFRSLDTLGAFRLIRRHFALHCAPIGRGGDAEPFDVRITGYSFGGWSALQVAHGLAQISRRFRVRLGLVDPVNTFRLRRPLTLTLTRRRIPQPLFAAPYATRPAIVDSSVSYFETKGLIARFGGDGWRMPIRARWFASQAIEGLINHDVSAELTEGGAHIEIAEKYAKRVAEQTFA